MSRNLFSVLILSSLISLNSFAVISKNEQKMENPIGVSKINNKEAHKKLVLSVQRVFAQCSEDGINVAVIRNLSSNGFYYEGTSTFAITENEGRSAFEVCKSIETFLDGSKDYDKSYSGNTSLKVELIINLETDELMSIALAE